MARAWQRNGFITEDEYYFLLKKNTFPLSMIDKITPHPDNRIADKLAADGLENAKPFVTEKGTRAAVTSTPKARTTCSSRTHSRTVIRLSSSAALSSPAATSLRSLR